MKPAPPQTSSLMRRPSTRRGGRRGRPARRAGAARRRARCEHGVGGARRGAPELGRRGRLDGALDAGGLERRDGEVVPGAGAGRRRRGGCRSGAARRSRRARSRGGRCRSGSRPGRRTTESSSRSAPRRSIVSTKFLPCGPNSQAAADDREVRRRGLGHGQLARELGAAVGAERVRGAGLGVRLARRAVERVVRRDLDRERAGGGRGGGDVARALRVDAGGELLALLRAVDVGPGGAVDDRVRGRVAHGLRAWRPRR